MRNKITPTDAAEIGARIRAARLRANISIVEVGKAAGVHHSQVSRYERGIFKTVSKNVQNLCALLQVKHPKLLISGLPTKELKERFDAVLEAIPGAAVVFSRLFDVLEASTRSKYARKRSLHKS